MPLVDARKRRKKRRRAKKRRHVVRPVAKKPAVKKAPAAKPTPATAGAVDPQTWVSPLPIPTVRERLFLNRFGQGFTQKALVAMRAAGTPEAWLARQLNPSSIAESAKIAQVDSWFGPLVSNSPAQKYATDQAKTKTAWQYGNDLGNWSMVHRIYSERSVLETMTDFWSHHFHIPIGADRTWAFRFDYDKTIREHAFGKFSDLLTACSLHPAMRLYLDNWKSVKNKPNENQGRELLELHTVGVGAGYTEAMVKDSAKILSGYTVTYGSSMAALYDPNKHTTGAVSVLGFSHANSSDNGQAVTEAYLAYLASHPATARRIAKKIATYFTGTAPSDALVDHLAGVYLANDTDIAAVLTALSLRPEFAGSAGNKVRTPYDDLVATARVLDIQATAPSSDQSWVNAINWVHGAKQLFSWPRPDGAPINGAAWATSSRLFASYRMHQSFAGGWWPTQAATYRSHASWLPASQVRFDKYVDHLSRQWLGRAADARTINAARQAVTRPEKWGVVSNSTVVHQEHMLATWAMPRLIIALLDTPDFMTS